MAYRLGLVMVIGAACPQAHAQQTPVATEAPVQSGHPADGAAPSDPASIEILGADGEPLPEDVQREIREHLRNNPLDSTGARTIRRTESSGDLVVTGERPRGSVIGDIPPERSFGPLDIRAFGTSNVGELLQSLGAQVESNRGRQEGTPITLLNGRRVSNFLEVARIPSEAIERMEVFPEEVALKYGFRPDQKIVNIVTFRSFASTTGLAAATLPTDGGRESGSGTIDRFVIRDGTRYGLGGDYARSAALLESQRDVIQPDGMTEAGRTRTLLPETERLSIDALASGTVIGDVSSTVNGRIETIDSVALLGQGADAGPIRRNMGTDTVRLGTTSSGIADTWLWTLTGTYDRTATRILTDPATVNVERDRARSVNALFDADLTMSGPLFNLPAGPVSAMMRAGFAHRDFDSKSQIGGIARDAALTRGRTAVQASLDLPITASGGGSPIGGLSANANIAMERLSDVGTLRSFGYGFTWSPLAEINVVASATDEERAPTLEQLGNPLVVTPNIRTYDFSRREVVDVTRIFGGNPALGRDTRRVTSLGLNVKPFAATDFVVNIDYLATRTDDPIAAFPILTPAIEAAFPDRFTRDADGQLMRIDSRPLNFRRLDQEQIRWGLNFTRPLGTVPAGTSGSTGRFFSSEAEMRRAVPNARVIRAEPGSAMARRAENMTSRAFVSLYHTWHLEDSLLTRDGGPVLDLLDGDAIEFRGGRRRHQVDLQAGAFKRGLGGRVTVQWQSATNVRSLGGAAGDLRFDDFGIVNLNLFANLADRIGPSSPPWLKATRLTVGVTNLFNTRPQVRDGSGGTPISYQPAYLDPLGRSLNISLRKIF